MKRILFPLALFAITTLSAQQATTVQDSVRKIYNIPFTVSELNTHFTNLEGIKVLCKKPGERTYNEVLALSTAIDSLEHTMVKYIKEIQDADKLEKQKSLEKPKSK